MFYSLELVCEHKMSFNILKCVFKKRIHMHPCAELDFPFSVPLLIQLGRQQWSLNNSFFFTRVPCQMDFRNRMCINFSFLVLLRFVIFSSYAVINTHVLLYDLLDDWSVGISVSGTRLHVTKTISDWGSLNMQFGTMLEI
jgi:hypothetical protein